MTKACGVYEIRIGERNFYYGSSINLVVRKQAHLSDLKAGRHRNRWMQRAWDKHQDFSFEIIEECDPEIVIQVEQKYLDEWHGVAGNMNMSNTAQGGCGPLTEEHRLNLSEALSGRTLSDEHRANLRKPKSAETRRKMSEAAQRRTKETCMKIADTLRGHEVSHETREKISASLRGRKRVAA
jgi:group I intron endonuclease